MPRARTHRRIGRPVGGAFAFVQALRSPLGDPLLEALGGMLGGDVGARLPDVFEPPCWHHRRTAHSIGTACSIVGSLDTVQAWAECCRRRADRHRGVAADATQSLYVSFWHSLMAMFWSAVAGCLNGLLAGYVSHLVLDARTKTSLPVL